VLYVMLNMIHLIATGIALTLTVFYVDSGSKALEIQRAEEGKKFQGFVYGDAFLALILVWNILAYVASSIGLQLTHHLNEDISNYTETPKKFILILGLIFLTLSFYRNCRIRKKYKLFMKNTHSSH
jgi:hypothetical protein